MGEVKVYEQIIRVAVLAETKRQAEAALHRVQVQAESTDRVHRVETGPIARRL